MDIEPAIIFYDGSCALCHCFVKYVAKRDAVGEFRFAPLQGETVKKLIPSNTRNELPDSVVVRTFPGELFLRSDGIIYVLKRLGGLSKLLGIFISFFPRAVRDRAYSFIASLRKKILGTNAKSCPTVSENIRDRFLL